MAREHTEICIRLSSDLSVMSAYAIHFTSFLSHRQVGVLQWATLNYGASASVSASTQNKH